MRASSLVVRTRERQGMLRALVISMDLGLRAFLQIMLGHRLSIEPVTAISKALTRAIDTEPELIILDLDACDCDLERLFEIFHFHLPKCRVIVLARDLTDFAVTCRATPEMIAVLSRPLELCQLIRKVEQILQGQHIRSQILQGQHIRS